MTDEEVAALWADLKAHILADAALTGPLRGTILGTGARGVMAGTLYLEVEDEYQRAELEQRARHFVRDAIESFGEDAGVTDFAVVVNPELVALHAATSQTTTVEPEPHPNVFERALQLVEPIDEDRYTDATPVKIERDPASNLNEKYTFDNFVIGASNRFAHAAAVAVAEAPAKSYNPLFIYGDSGLGKTHLLHAMGNYAMSMYPGIKVKYVSSEEFTNDFVNSISVNKAAEFQDRYRSVDLLLIDDIQFLQGKESTVEAFFHTFNTLHQNEKQVVITSDLQPRQLSGFEERLRSRFEWGLLADVQSPDLETRIAILRNKAQADGLEIPYDAAEYIASNVTNSVRELEGALIRVAAYASLNGIAKIDLETVMTALKDVISSEEPVEVRPEDIVSATATYFNLSVEDLYGRSRAQHISLSRQICMYLCREMTNLSLPKLGQLFGDRDHTTVMHAVRNIEKLITTDRRVYEQCTELTARIRQPRGR